ncbi:MAG: DUF1670 domain-containing protein [Calditrichaeota bacterium]|nr:DUF1670 domain-containing protein [Calditrichota bacterium]
MNKTAASRSYAKMIYGPSQKKTLHNLLKRELVLNFGFENKLKIADVLIESMLDIINTYGRETEQMKAHQILWPAVDKDDFPGYGKSMDKTKHKLIVLTLWTDAELNKIVNGLSPKALLKDRIARFCQEAYAQDTLLSMVDIALILNISPSYAVKLRIQWEKEHDQILKTRGSYHDLGMTLTHKRQIIKDHLKGLMPSEIARKHKHEPSSVDRYIGDFERTLPFFQENQSDAKIAFYTRMSEHLVREYRKLYQEFYLSDSSD